MSQSQYSSWERVTGSDVLDLEAGPPVPTPADLNADDRASSAAMANFSSVGGKMTCVVCGSTIGSRQVEHAVHCTCGRISVHGHAKGGKNCFSGKRSAQAAVIIQEGYVKEDGSANFWHPYAVEFLNNARPFSVDDSSGTIGFVSKDGLWCKQCHVQSPSVRALFGTRQEESDDTWDSSGDETECPELELPGPPPKRATGQMRGPKDSGEGPVVAPTNTGTPPMPVPEEKPEERLAESLAGLMRPQSPEATMGAGTGAPKRLRREEQSRPEVEPARTAGTRPTGDKVRGELPSAAATVVPGMQVEESAAMIYYAIKSRTSAPTGAEAKGLETLLFRAHREIQVIAKVLLGWQGNADFPRPTFPSFVEAMRLAANIPTEPTRMPARAVPAAAVDVPEVTPVPSCVPKAEGPASASTTRGPQAVCPLCGCGIRDSEDGIPRCAFASCGWIGKKPVAVGQRTLPPPTSLAALGDHEADIVAGGSLLPGRTPDPVQRTEGSEKVGGDAKKGPTVAKAPATTMSAQGISKTIERTMADGNTAADLARLHEKTRAMYDLFTTLDQSDAMRAGDESHHGVVLTFLHSVDEVKRTWQKVSKAMKQYEGSGGMLGQWEITEVGLVRPTKLVAEEVRCLWMLQVEDIPVYWESMEERCLSWDARDGTHLAETLKEFKKLVFPKYNYAMGVEPSADPAQKAYMHDKMLRTIHLLRWLIRFSKEREGGRPPKKLMREFLDDYGGDVMRVNIRSLDRDKAAREQARREAAEAKREGAALGTRPMVVPVKPVQTGHGSQVSVDGPLWGPQETVDPAVVERAARVMLDWNFCHNCRTASDHCVPLCPQPRIASLPCEFCTGEHHERDCPGPTTYSRAAWAMKKELFFKRVQLMRNKRPKGDDKMTPPPPGAPPPPRADPLGGIPP